MTVILQHNPLLDLPCLNEGGSYYGQNALEMAQSLQYNEIIQLLSDTQARSRRSLSSGTPSLASTRSRASSSQFWLSEASFSSASTSRRSSDKGFISSMSTTSHSDTESESEEQRDGDTAARALAVPASYSGPS